MKTTSLLECHQELGARFVEFAGWQMPVSYGSANEEHLAVRNAAGLFDVSHMGEILVSGELAAKTLDRVLSNDIAGLSIGSAQYNLILNEEGGVIDDVIVYRLTEGEFLICVNAANTAQDFSWLKATCGSTVVVEDCSAGYAQVALQGPCARAILASLLDTPPGSLSYEAFPPFKVRPLRFGAVELLVATTGYTGEDGFEIFCATSDGPVLWRSMLEIGSNYGLKPVGLSARDTLRLEACYPLYGQEIRADVDALSSGMGWVIKLDKDEFIGRDALRKIAEQGAPLRLVGVGLLDKGICRTGHELYSDSKKVGWITSGTKLPTIERAVGLAFVEPEFSAIGTKLKAAVRERMLETEVIRKPFYRRAKSSS